MQKRNGEEIIQVDECPGLPSAPSTDLKIALRKWEERNGYVRPTYREKQAAIASKPRKSVTVSMRALSEYEIKSLFRKFRKASKPVITEFIRSLNRFDGELKARWDAAFEAARLNWSDDDKQAVALAIRVAAGISSL